MNEKVKEHQREWLVKMLRNQVCEVVFEKADGTERKMICTLKEDLLPESTNTSTKTERKQPTNAVPVWDIQSEGWRSFRVDRLMEFREYNGE